MKQAPSLTSTRNKEYILPSNKEKSEYVKRNFDEISEGYDSFNDWITFGMHRIWKRKTALATRLKGIKNELVLDLCSGSGDIAIQLSRNFPHSRIYAIDFSAGMLDILKKRIRAKNLERQIKIKQGNISRLNFIKSGSADAVTMGFGLRNVESRERVMKEILRVLKPGGIYVNLDVGHVRGFLPALFHRFYFEKIVPLIGFLLHGGKHEMYCYLPASARRYPDQISLKKELEKAGFREIRIKNFMLGAAAMHVAKKPDRK